ncbi:hypothetical protein LJR074_003491 [Acidovorax sp. LjRoot74]|uniref:hypothetical protein n=1 Tax=Acidovorax sp. LjRoot74 TaxID=3342337 RepID=UPI003ECDC55F
MNTDTDQLKSAAVAPLARVLPTAAAMLLRQAAETVIAADPLARVKAIERAIARVKREWPAYFRG